MLLLSRFLRVSHRRAVEIDVDEDFDCDANGHERSEGSEDIADRQNEARGAMAF